jgi:hypothetical protein
MDEEDDLELTCSQCGKTHTMNARHLARMATKSEWNAISGRGERSFPCFTCMGAKKLRRHVCLMMLDDYARACGRATVLRWTWGVRVVSPLGGCTT